MDYVTDDVRIDPSFIPAHAWDYLAAGTMELLRTIQSTPEGRAKLEAKTAEVRARWEGDKHDGRTE